jgi:hypothetical protein
MYSREVISSDSELPAFTGVGSPMQHYIAGLGTVITLALLSRLLLTRCLTPHLVEPMH